MKKNVQKQGMGVYSVIIGISEFGQKQGGGFCMKGTRLVKCTTEVSFLPHGTNEPKNDWQKCPLIERNCLFTDRSDIFFGAKTSAGKFSPPSTIATDETLILHVFVRYCFTTVDQFFRLKSFTTVDPWPFWLRGEKCFRKYLQNCQISKLYTFSIEYHTNW